MELDAFLAFTVLYWALFGGRNASPIDLMALPQVKRRISLGQTKPPPIMPG